MVLISEKTPAEWHAGQRRTQLLRFSFSEHFRLSGKPFTFGPFRGLALRHAGSQSISDYAFFGQAILVFHISFPAHRAENIDSVILQKQKHYSLRFSAVIRPMRAKEEEEKDTKNIHTYLALTI